LGLALVKLDRAGDVDGLACKRADIGKFAGVSLKDYRRKGVVRIMTAHIHKGHAGAVGRIDLGDDAFDGDGLTDMLRRVGRRNGVRQRQSGSQDEPTSEAKSEPKSQN